MCHIKRGRANSHSARVHWFEAGGCLRIQDRSCSGIGLLRLRETWKQVAKMLRRPIWQFPRHQLFATFYCIDNFQKKGFGGGGSATLPSNENLCYRCRAVKQVQQHQQAAVCSSAPHGGRKQQQQQEAKRRRAAAAQGAAAARLLRSAVVKHCTVHTTTTALLLAAALACQANAAKFANSCLEEMVGELGS